MLTTPEKILFLLATLVTIYAAYRASDRIVRTIARGQGKIDWGVIPKRLPSALFKTISFQPVFRTRFWASLFHGLVAWGFIFYLLVNLGDVLEGYLPDFVFLGQGLVGDLYRLFADLFSVGTLVGMVALILRRFVLRPPALSARQDILLHPKARLGIRRDSAIVGVFILVHVGSRFLGASFKIAHEGQDVWQPFASAVAGWWSNLSPAAVNFGEHAGFWLALGTILGFIPYFLYSKHIHLFFAPFNFLLKPERHSMGELSKLDFDDESIEQFGATHLEDLGWEQIMDAYACIMCYRCQDACPAYNTGKVLSPAALEINKRYFLNYEGARLAKGEASQTALLDFAITPEAVWACTACGACVDICPVGNEPMRDILDIRRSLVLMENNFPDQLQTAFRGMERTMNPWNVPPTERMKWAEGLQVPTVNDVAEPEILWWVGCAPATDARAQKTAQAFAKILNAAEVNYAVLGEMEQCTGDSARRAGNEYLFHEMALANVEMLNEVAPPRIVTTCPHCLHTIKTEYPAFGGNYEVIHHSQLINELVGAGRLKLQGDATQKITFHDPCYLGRHNDIVNDPRQALQQTQVNLVEMPRHGKKSFCCGAGGAQMWKEEEHGDERVNLNRFKEAQATGATSLAVGCPFCMVMLNDAGKDAGSQMEILDIAEIVVQALVKVATD
ncbi:MAG: 4Fe-4S dicluster domain-containing protein [Anaerolineales bacterium]|nr:MAG: 4Fe-4S dicluster domain-containing protein [Anaerolineales bacterium]